jgi:hypothetical protein
VQVKKKQKERQRTKRVGVKYTVKIGVVEPHRKVIGRNKKKEITFSRTKKEIGRKPLSALK